MKGVLVMMRFHTAKVKGKSWFSLMYASRQFDKDWTIASEVLKVIASEAGVLSSFVLTPQLKSSRFLGSQSC
jgi:hypothetical protein